MDKKKLTTLVKKHIKQMGHGPLPAEDVKTLVDSIAEKPEEFRKEGAFNKAVNYFVNAYNKVRFKKVPDELKNTAKPGEKHQPILLPNKSMTVAKFSGPGTQLITRIKEELRKNNNDLKAVKGVSAVDNVALRHDIDYALAQNTDDIREADKLMVKRVAKIAAKGQDNKYNTISGALIAGKIAAEEVGALSKDKFASFEEIPENEKIILQQLRDLNTEEMIGYGPKMDKLKKAAKIIAGIAGGLIAVGTAQRQLIRATMGEPLKMEPAGASTVLKDVVLTAKSLVGKGARKLTDAELKLLVESLDTKKEIEIVGKAVKKLKGEGKRAPSKWNLHLKDYMSKNKGVSLKVAMGEAKKTYKK